MKVASPTGGVASPPWDDEPPPGDRIIDGTGIFEPISLITKDGAQRIKVNGNPLQACALEPGPLAATGAECDTVANTFKVQVLSLSDFALFRLQPVVPALRPTGLLALTVLLLAAGALLLRGRAARSNKRAIEVR